MEVLKINNCYLLNFRNFNNLNIRFFEKINVITGGNAQGKTNILEGVYFSAKGKSFKSVKESDLIKIDKRESFIRTDIESDSLEEKIEVKLSKDSTKVIRINENKIDTMQELRTFFDIVTFIPEDIKIIKESKSYRRDFMDEVITGVIPSYNSLLIKYNNILNQRNYILKYKNKGRYFNEQLQASTKLLAQEGAKIMKMRSKYIGIIEDYALEIHKSLTRGKETISIIYNGNKQEYDYDIIKNSQVLYYQMEENIDRDLNLGFTSVGPHRDDISIFINDMDSRTFLSQGQQRTLTLSLKLSQLRLYDDLKEVSPVILLDDVFSELDRERTNYLLNSIRDYQSIITSTDSSFLQDYTGEYRVFELMDNELKVKKFR